MNRNVNSKGTKDASKMNVHFMGIGGSGLSGVAVMSKKNGFEVSGCDLESETPYLSKVKKENIKVFYKHDKSHLLDTDLLVVSPAIIYQNKNHPEYTIAKGKEMVKTWDEFLGQYLLKDKKVICISGTHGKSTTTALAGLLFERAKIDPNVLVGAKVTEWGTNYRDGESDLFILESDEFFEKFLNYNPQTIILNNIEFDHPDYFTNEEQVIKSFKKFIKKLSGDKILIINLDSIGNLKLIKLLDSKLHKGLNIYGYTLKQTAPIKIKNTVFASISNRNSENTTFSVYSEELNLNDTFRLKVPGDYNVSNALGVLILGLLFKLRVELIKSVFSQFGGVGRRLELLGETKSGTKVIDDYAHHPTAIRETLRGLRQKYPTQKIHVVVEPHSFSRTKALIKDYSGVFDLADEVIIGPIFQARDTKEFKVNEKSIVEVSNHKSICYKKNINEIISHLIKSVDRESVVIVMGAGKSFFWSSEILKNLP